MWKGLVKGQLLTHASGSFLAKKKQLLLFHYKSVSYSSHSMGKTKENITVVYLAQKPPRSDQRALSCLPLAGVLAHIHTLSVPIPCPCTLFTANKTGCIYAIILV